MPVFKYKAIDGSGKTIESTHTAANREQMVDILRSRGSIPIRIEEIKEAAGLSLGFLSSRVKTRDIAVFCRQFYTMLNTGIPIINCLDILRGQSESKGLKGAIDSIYEDVQMGVALSDALRKLDDIFPELFINMVEAGEVSGNLDAIMLRMSVHYDKEARIKAKIGGAMIYPVILMIAIVVVIVALLTFVMPMFIELFTSSGVAMPAPTRMLIALSNSLVNYWYIYFILIASFGVGFSVFSKTHNGARFVDGLKLRLPYFKGPIRKIITSRFTRTLSTLMVSGIPLMQSLEITSKIVGNTVVQDYLLQAKDRVSSGVALSVPIKESGLFPPMVYSMVMVGEESGTLDEILEQTADFYDAEVEAAMQAMVAVFEPVLIVVMALIVGFIVVSIFLPMLDMMTTIQ